MARRFVTYNTEDQKAGRVNVDHNGVMKPGGGASLPSLTAFYAKMGNAYLYTDSAYENKVTNQQLKDAISINNVRIIYEGEYRTQILFPLSHVYDESFGSTLSVLEIGEEKQKTFYTAEYVEEG